MNPISLMPLESEYADDVDFIDEELIRLEFVLPVASHVLKEDWNLNINNTKTEYTRFYIASADELDSNNQPVKDNEPWRISRLLGSYMCSTFDITQKCILGNVAFNNYKQVWLKGRIIHLRTLIEVYEAMVISVMLYNCSSWAAPQNILYKLDVCHRRHLRYILGIKWPTTISNEKLYTTCRSEPLSNRVKLARWKMLGHILRSPENSPASLALSFAIDGSKYLKGRRGRHQINLLTTLRKDLSEKALRCDSGYEQLTLKNGYDIEKLRHIAHNRRKWKELFYCRTVL